jgi:hypothetical protein
MTNSAIVGSSAAADSTKRLKRVARPGRSTVGFGSDTPMVFDTLFKDDLYPQTGLASTTNFTVPVSGVYSLYLECDWPSGGAPGVGWTLGYSGAGGSKTYMQWWRGAVLMEDNIALVNMGLPDDPNHHWAYAGPVQRTLQAGDVIKAIGQGGATGNGPSCWNAMMDIQLILGGGGVTGVVPQNPAPVSGPTGNTQNDMGIGGAANDGWQQGSNCIYTNYSASIPYAEAKNAGWRLQGRITLDATYSGAGAYARFLSGTDMWESAIMQNNQTPNPWTSAWVDISPPLASLIQVRLQISRVSGGIGKNIAVASCLQEFQWVTP